MNPIGIIRRIDDIGRVVIPKEIRRTLKIKEGDPLEIIPNYNGTEIVIRPYRKSWEDTVLEWWEANRNMALRYAAFSRVNDYTFCVVTRPNDCSRGGYAKRFFKDKDDYRIAQVAAYAKAIHVPIDKLVGWKG
jgi:AbrB family looped-hinge helix DNA binding protein